MLKRLAQISVLTFALSATFVHAEDYSEPAMEKKKVKEAGPDLSNGSEYMYQPEAKAWDVIPRLGVDVVGTKYSSNNLKRFEAVTPIGVEGTYGINEMFAVGIDLAYTNVGRTYTCDNKPCPDNNHSRGLEDPKLIFKGRNHFGRHTLRYGADLSVSLEKHKIESSGNSNMASGGYTLAPWVGYETSLGERHMLGAKLQYDLLKSDRKITDSTAIGNVEEPGSSTGDQTLSGGRVLDLAVFYEMHLHKLTPGVAVHLAHREESRLAIKDAPSAPNRDQGMTTGVQFYAPVYFTERIALLPEIHFNAIAYPNSNTYDAGVDFGGSVAGRFTF